MRTSMLLGMFDWISEFFSNALNLIPKLIYILYASLACLLDILQLFFRKLAGLDVYYQEIGGKLQTISGDLVTNFISGILGIGGGQHYPVLTTTFWSMVIFGVIVCISCVFIAVIKSHYSYDEKAAKGPMQYVYTGLKSLVNIAAVPIIIVLGLWVSQAVLTALDQITSVTSGNLLSIFGSQNLNQNCLDVITSTNIKRDQNGNIIDDSVNDGQKSFIFYDIFGFGSKIYYGTSPIENSNWLVDQKASVQVAAANQTFSGSLFTSAAYNANRVRLGQITLENAPGIKGEDGVTLFKRATEVGDQGVDLLADMVDLAFANNLHLDGKVMDLNYSWGDANTFSYNYFTNFFVNKISVFSKFNVGAIWCYYDLWQFNFIVGFGAIIICASIFVNIILGMMGRFFMCIGLFLIAPPIFALEPLDGGNGKKAWIKEFMKQALMAYGAVLAMNIFFLIFPYVNEIKFFNIAIADYFVTALFIIVGLITVKSFIQVISGIIGAADANETGNKIGKEVSGGVVGAAKMTLGAAKFPIKAGKMVAHGAMTAVRGAQAAKNTFSSWGADRAEKEHENFGEQMDLMKDFAGQTFADEKELKKQVKIAARGKGFSRSQTKDLQDTMSKKYDKYTKQVGDLDSLVNEHENTLVNSWGLTRSGATAKKLAKDWHLNVDAYAEKDAFTSKIIGKNAAYAIKSKRLQNVSDYYAGLKTQRTEQLRRSVAKTSASASGMFKFLDDGTKSVQSDFVQGIKEGIKPKPDWSKETASEIKSLKKDLKDIKDKL